MSSHNTNSIYTTRIDCMDLSMSCGYTSMLLEYNPVRQGVVHYTDSVSYALITSCLAVSCTPHSSILGGYSI